MRFCFLVSLSFFMLTVTTVYAEGLPANPWIAKNVNNTAGAGYAQTPNEQVTNSVADTTAEDIAELKNTMASIERKLEQNQNNNLQTSAQPANDNVNTVEALGALNTLSRYMHQSDNVQNTENTQNTDKLNNLKEKFSEMMAQGKKKTSASNSYATKKVNKAKYEYNHYKAQLQSNYNSIKNKTKPLYDTVKKSVQDAEKAAGVNF